MCTNCSLMIKAPVSDNCEWYLKKKKFKIKDNYGWRFFGPASNLGPDYDLSLRHELHFDDWNLHLKNAEFVSIPCGNCIECRLYYSREWASRCMLEAMQYSHNWFLTLTYDDEHLPLNDLGNPTLRTEDFTNFIKRLRTKFEREKNFQGCRFYGNGEYGDESLRPHYHVLLFNCPLDDLTEDIPFFDKETKKVILIQKKDQDGLPMYFSQFVKDIWPYGNIIIGRVSWNSAAYVARYILKKQKGVNADFYKQFHLVPEFIRMSRKPGIGGAFFDINADKILKDDKIYLYKKGGSFCCTPPRYFEKFCEKNLAYNRLLYDNKIKRQEKRKRRLLVDYYSSTLSKIERDNRQNFLNKVRSTIFKRNKV